VCALPSLNFPKLRGGEGTARSVWLPWHVSRRRVGPIPGNFVAAEQVVLRIRNKFFDSSLLACRCVMKLISSYLRRALSSLVSRLVRATDGSFSQGPPARSLSRDPHGEKALGCHCQSVQSFLVRRAGLSVSRSSPPLLNSCTRLLIKEINWHTLPLLLAPWMPAAAPYCPRIARRRKDPASPNKATTTVRTYWFRARRDLGSGGRAR
jgi:hypothetical protein